MRFPWRRKPASDPPTLEELARRQIGTEDIGAIAAALRAAGFLPTSYRAENEDLRSVLANDEQAILHFLTYCGDFAHIHPVTPKPEGFARVCALRTPSRLKADVLANLLSCFNRRGDGLWAMPAEDRKFLLDDLRASIQSVASIYVIAGDSHSSLYRHLVAPGSDRFFIPLHILCTGASARGLASPTSRSGAGARLVDLATSLPDGMDLLFKFGQVDVEFVFTFERLEAGKTAFDEAAFLQFSERSANAYMRFLADYFESQSVHVLSVFPPTLSDAAWREGYTNAQIVAVEAEQALDDIVRGIRDLEIPPLVERTRHHVMFNEMIAAEAAKAGFAFLDDLTPLLGPDGTVDLRFIPTHRGSDHHLEHSPTADVLSSLIGSHLATTSRDGGRARATRLNAADAALPGLRDCR